MYKLHETQQNNINNIIIKREKSKTYCFNVYWLTGLDILCHDIRVARNKAMQPILLLSITLKLNKFHNGLIQN